MPIDIEVFKHTHDSANLENAGVDVDYDDCDIDTITFYNIDYVGQWSPKDKPYGIIGSGGREFISPYLQDQINEIIKQHGK